MSINIPVYNNVNTVTKTITVDVVGDVLAPSMHGGVSDKEPTYYVKFIANSTDTENHTLPAKVCLGLTDLCLNGIKQSATNSSAAYADIKSMIVDYSYDFVFGHDLDQWGSGVKKQFPMKM